MSLIRVRYFPVHQPIERSLEIGPFAIRRYLTSEESARCAERLRALEFGASQQRSPQRLLSTRADQPVRGGETTSDRLQHGGASDA